MAAVRGDGPVIRLFDAQDLGELGERIRAASAAVGDRKVWEALGKIGEEETARRLADAPRGTQSAPGHGPEGEDWPPWSEGYRHEVAKSGNANHVMLHATGDLRQSISSAGEPGEAAWGSDDSVVYGGVHQYGREESGVLARPYVGFGPAERAAMTAALVSAIEAGFR